MMKIKGFNRLVRVSFEGYEEDMMKLFVGDERRWKF